jgi:2-hydroxychromene-2-carboxylate isomerase
MLTVYLDFKSPAAYLAIRPTLDLAQRCALEIAWRPFRAIEREVPKLGGDETVGQRHRLVRAAAQRALAIKYARHQDIDLRFPETPACTDLALGVLAQIREDPLPFIHAAFRAYWHEHADLDDDATVKRLLAESGVTMTGPLSEARPLLRVLQDDAEARGVVGVPGYLINDQIFVGREHLPWIEDLLLHGGEPSDQA